MTHIATPYAKRGVLTSVASSASSVTLLPATEGGRRGASVYNESTAILYLACGDWPASSTAYTCQVGANAYYEVPYGYSGPIKGIWASANGSARITEYI